MALTQVEAYGGAVETLSNHHSDREIHFGDKKPDRFTESYHLLLPKSF